MAISQRQWGDEQHRQQCSGIASLIDYRCKPTMKRLILQFLLGLMIFVSWNDVGAERIKLLPDFMPTRQDKLVIGGRYSAHGEFPFQVSIQIIGEPAIREAHVCGGCLLDENTVLTAAHCLFSPLQQGHYEIVAGNNQLKGPHEREQRRKIGRIYIHPNYSMSTQEADNALINDIAIVRVRVPFVFNDFVRAARLPQADVYPEGDAQVSGWSFTEKGHSAPISESLRVAELPLLSRVECQAALKVAGGFRWARTLLCTNPGHNAGTPWKGDSGSPLTQDDVVIGIVSTGDYDTTLVAYTRVSAFRQWIDSKMPGSSNPTVLPKKEL